MRFESWVSMFCIEHLTISLKLLHLQIACVNEKIVFLFRWHIWSEQGIT